MLDNLGPRMAVFTYKKSTSILTCLSWHVRHDGSQSDNPSGAAEAGNQNNLQLWHFWEWWHFVIAVDVSWPVFKEHKGAGDIKRGVLIYLSSLHITTFISYGSVSPFKTDPLLWVLNIALVGSLSLCGLQIGDSEGCQFESCTWHSSCIHFGPLSKVLNPPEKFSRRARWTADPAVWPKALHSPMYACFTLKMSARWVCGQKTHSDVPGLILAQRANKASFYSSVKWPSGDPMCTGDPVHFGVTMKVCCEW